MNSKRDFKDALFEQFTRITKALANPKRLELIDVLAQGERTVERLADEIHQSIANTSQHLQTLKAAQLVEVRREGHYAYYRLADAQVFTVWQAVRSLGETRLAEIDRVVNTYLNDKQSLERITATELLTRLEQDDVVVLDVRPAEEYAAGHIPGARSLPSTQIAQRLSELPKDKTVVAYCRGPYCVMAHEALTVLKQHGYHGLRLEEGLPDWKAAGYPVQQETAQA